MVPRGGAALANPAGMFVFMKMPWMTFSAAGFALATLFKMSISFYVKKVQQEKEEPQIL